MMTGEFINVDLDVESPLDVGPLVEALDRGVSGAHALHVERRRGRHFVSFELNRGPRSAEDAVIRFARLIERLPPKARAVWDAAVLRSFDVGVRSGTAFPPAVLKLSTRAVERVAALGGQIVFTVYPPEAPAAPSDALGRSGGRSRR